MPREPYRRCSQAIFEQWLKPRIQADPRIDSHFGLRFKGLTQHKDHVISELVDEAGATHLVKSKYVVGCDGAGSAVRRAVGIELRGGPV
jgi:FAD-dependent monooxygenase